MAPKGVTGFSGEMAIEDWINYDYDEDFNPEPEAFDCTCKWCGKKITMTPTDAGWKPMKKGKPHACQERIDAHSRDLLDLLPDLSLPQCQFCNSPMEYRKHEADPEDWSWMPRFRLTCTSCGAMGPEISEGPLYNELIKR